MVINFYLDGTFILNGLVWHHKLGQNRLIYFVKILKEQFLCNLLL